MEESENLAVFMKHRYLPILAPHRSPQVKVTTMAAAISSLMAQIYTLKREIDPSLLRPPPVPPSEAASSATSAVIITFRREEAGDTFSVWSANFPPPTDAER